MTTLRTRLQTGPALWLLRSLLWTVVLSLIWLQVSPVYAADHVLVRSNAQRAAWRLAHTPHVNLPAGLTETPDAVLRAKIDAKKATETAKPVADVRPLTDKEMQTAHGRGALRNPYFNGTLPWQRSFHDVNTTTGNLFKSFTDMQIAPARGAGLVLQRTYNSNEARIGPFGVGWTHAYDIRIQEAAAVKAESGNPSPLASLTAALSAEVGHPVGDVDTAPDFVPRTDFFGAKHVYHRDADGLYSSPTYMFDEMDSDYDSTLVTGPTKVMDDTEKGEDGTIKHYVSILTPAAGNGGAEGNERACDYIQDRHGNTTNLTYGLSYVQPDGSTRKLLTQVTDPSGRSLAFTWTNLGTSAQPAYRITQVQGPLVSGSPVAGVTYTVSYAYYTDASEANAANDLYNLRSVTLDPDGLNRTTTYTYTSCTATYVQNSQQQTDTENALLATVADPLGHTVTYHYTFYTDTVPECINSQPNPLGTVYVTQIDEPVAGGIHSWHLWLYNASQSGTYTGGEAGGPGTRSPAVYGCVISSENAAGPQPYPVIHVFVFSDAQLRTVADYTGDDAGTGNGIGVTNGYALEYDAANNVVDSEVVPDYVFFHQDYYAGGWIQATFSSYGAHGNLLTRTRPGFAGTMSCTYYNASQYFAKATVTDYNGHTTAMGVGTSTDANVGNRGETLWAQDAGYNDTASPSYHKQATYTYNQYGQKATETNLNGTVTQYSYGTGGDLWGNLTQVVQDPGAGHLNRTTAMTYDAAGRVLTSTDPSSLTSVFTYNTLGQPLTVATPVRGSAPAETISYAYDGNGRTHSVTDNRGTTTLTYESGEDRVASVTDPMTGTTSYTYTPTGERAMMTLPGGGTWTYAYASRALTETDYALLPKDDPGSASLSPWSITDDQGRVVSLEVAGTGQLISQASDQVFDSSGTLVSYLQTQNNLEKGQVSVNQYGVPLDNVRGTLAQVVQTYWWRPATGNGGYGSWRGRPLSENDYTYDNAGQRLTNTSTQPVVTGTGGPQYTGGTPTIDNLGHVTNEVTSSRTETYTYDDLSRLATVNYGDGETQAYTFDAMGNRLSKSDTAGGTTTTTSYTVDAANRLTAAGGNAYTNDADGNTLTGGGRTNTWDSQNRLVSCIVSGNTSTYKYGADGLRRQATKNSVTTDYAYDGTMMVREGHATGGSLTASTVTATYFIGASGPCYRRDDTATEIDSQGRTVTKARWYVYDGLGSVVGEVDPLGNLTSSPKYDVYGAVRANGGTASSKHGFVGSLGHVSDDTGLIYMRARYYDPAMGRFISQDPGLSGTNWYVYCSNNPINAVDSDGKVAAWVAAMLFGAVVAMGIYFMDCAYNHQTPTLGGFLKAAIIGAVGALIIFATLVVVGVLVDSAAILSFANGAIGGLALLALSMVGFDCGMAISIASHALTPILTHILGIEMALAESDAEDGM